MIPQDVQDLLADLSPDPDRVGTIDSSKMVVQLGSRTFELGHEDCERVLQTPASVKQLVDLIGNRASVELHALDLSGDVMETLERSCASIDEI